VFIYMLGYHHCLTAELLRQLVPLSTGACGFDTIVATQILCMTITAQQILSSKQKRFVQNMIPKEPLVKKSEKQSVIQYCTRSRDADGCATLTC